MSVLQERLILILSSIFALLALATDPIELSSAKDSVDERYASHPRFENCEPPSDFAERFHEFDLNRVKKRSSKRFLRSKTESRDRGPIIGAEVDTQDVYAKRVFGVSSLIGDITYASVKRTIGEENKYFLGISNTRQRYGSVERVNITINEIFIRTDSGIISFTNPERGRRSFCGYGQANNLCHSTGWVHFELDKQTFDQLANSDPSKPFPIVGKHTNGDFSKCPFFFSPLSFQAASETIDKHYEKALRKRQRELDRANKSKR